MIYVSMTISDVLINVILFLNYITHKQALTCKNLPTGLYAVHGFKS